MKSENQFSYFYMENKNFLLIKARKYLNPEVSKFFAKLLELCYTDHEAMH